MNYLLKLIQIERDARNFGFDWPNFQNIINQAIDECREIQEVVDLGESKERLQEEIGDLLFTAVSMCRFSELDVEKTLEISYKKFKSRINTVKDLTYERGLRNLRNQPHSLLMELWDEAKAHTELPILNNDIHITVMTLGDIKLVVESFTNADWHKPASLFIKYLDEQQHNQRLIKLAFYKDQLAGYATLKWNSDYQYFSCNNIPEIKDLNVLPKYRKKGIATRLIEELETATYFRKYNRIGIGVGLYADYANALALYINKGYKPDGNGISYNDEQIQYGEDTKLDDNLTLMFVKELSST